MAVFTGDSGNNTVTGGAENDSVIGGGGSDLVQGLGGNDDLRGDETTGGGGGGLVLTPTAQGYLTAGSSLSNGLGGSAGFGENVLPGNDDGSTSQVDISSVFTAGLNFFGVTDTTVFINNNGNITFNQTQGTFTPFAITGVTNNPIIAAFFADVDTRSGAQSATPGGNSTGTNLLYYDLDTVNHVFTVTWDDVGYFSGGVDKLNAFQLQLVDRGSGDFDIVFRYEDINWTTGGASGGSGGLGGTIARAGFSSGTGTFFELPQAGIQGSQSDTPTNPSGMLDLDNVDGNSGRPGVWIFEVRNGNVSSPGNDTLDGGAGNDTIDGGQGDDVALFTSPSSAYNFSLVNSNTFGVTGPDGNDTLINVEFGQFAGGPLVAISSLVPGAPEPIELTATGTRPIDTGAPFDPTRDELVQFIPVSASVPTANSLLLNLLGGGTFAADGDSASLTFPRTASNGAAQAVDEITNYTITGNFEAAVTPAVTSLMANGATVGGPAITGNALIAAGQGLVTAAENVPLDQLTIDTLTNSDNGDPHYRIDNLDLTGADIAPFFAPLLQPGGTIDLPGLIDMIGSRPVSITGSPGNDTISTFGGNDTINGGGGIDVIVVPSAAGAANVTTSGGNATIDGAFGTVSVTGVEAVNFTDQTMVLSGNLPVLSIASLNITEGASGSANAVFTASLSAAAPAGGVTAQVEVLGIGTNPAIIGLDLNLPLATVTIPEGQTNASILIPILGDLFPEAAETFSVRLRDATNAVPGFQSTATGTIANDDGVGTLSVNSVSVAEGTNGLATATFQVSVSAAMPVVTTVAYSVNSGSALANSDFIPLTGTLLIPAGSTTATIDVAVLGDVVDEPNETFTVALTSVSGNPAATLGPNSTGTGTITDDDAPVAIAITGQNVTDDDNAGAVRGTSANDSIAGNGGPDTIFGDPGSDIIDGGNGDDLLIADLPGEGDDSVTGGPGADTLLGGSGNDTVVGGTGSDFLIADIGDETGNDLAIGDDGDDVAFGGAGIDSLVGGNGVDFLFGFGGADFMDGGTGNDRIHVDALDIFATGAEGFFDVLVLLDNINGANQINLGLANNQNVSTGPILQGIEAVDASIATGPVTVTGAAFQVDFGQGPVTAGNVLFGSAFADSFTGSTAADIILGAGGPDIINAGPGNDTIIADTASDTVSGGFGNDVFFYPDLPGTGAVRVLDFTPGVDELQISASFGLTPAQALAQTVQSGLNSVLTFSAGHSVTLVGIPKANLSADDFGIV